MGYHLPDYKLTDEWTDLCSLGTYSEITGKTVTVQAKYVTEVNVFIGGDSAPAGNNGALLKTLAAISSVNDHWWVKGYGHISVLVED